MTLATAETLDMSRLGAPTLAEVNFEATRARLLTEFLRLWAQARALDPTLPDYDVQTLETDPAVILTEEFAFGDTLLRQAINDAANALRLATASNADLDHIAKTYHNTQRLLLDTGDLTATPPRDPIYEGDDEYRLRAQLAPEAYPLYGITPGGYSYRIRKLYGDQVKGVRALRRGGGRLDLILLGRSGSGVVAPTLIGDLQAMFDGDAGSQSTDIVTVFPATIVETSVRVVLGVPRGPDTVPVIAAARAAIAQLGADRHVIGETLHRQAIGAVAKVGPVRFVRVETPLADVVGGDAGAPFITAIEVTAEIDE